MTNLDFTTIGQKIKERRKELGYTQDYVASRLDVNPSHISNIEAGRANPSLTALVQIANILECSVDRFLDSEYTYESAAHSSQTLDDKIISKIKHCSMDKKNKLLQIIFLYFILYLHHCQGIKILRHTIIKIRLRM